MQSIRLMSSLLVSLAAGLLALSAVAAELPTEVSVMPAANTGSIQVPIYKSRVLSTRAAVKRISVGNPEIADILITSPRQLYLLGRSLGSTNVLLWDGNNKLIDSLDLDVVHDLGGLKSKLHQLLPNENIEVFSAQGALVLRGQVSSAAAMDSAMKIAKSYAAQSTSIAQGEGEKAEAGPSDSLEVVNLMTVGGGQQVMLEVKVAEMQRNLVKRLGVNFLALGSAGNWDIGTFNGGSSIADTGLQTPLGDGVGQVIPSLTKRSAQSTVELGDGQTIAIAGLINENTRDLVSRFPGLGDIAVIGHLFRSQEFIKGETELVILVTPHIAKPVDAKLVRLPTERFVEPGDMDFYLLGKTKGDQPGRAVPVSLGVTGSSFGHDLK
jgi:Flp pilus assembly secretin CpaC